MTPASLDAAAAVALSWLLTYAIHSTILLAIAMVAAWRLSDHHAWLDVIWKTAVLAPLVTASLQFESVTLPIGRWTMTTETAAALATAPVTSSPDAPAHSVATAEQAVVNR